MFNVLYVFPILLSLLWIKPISKNLVVPEYMTDDIYCMLRASLVMAMSAIRFFLLRFEVQNHLDNGGSIVYSMLVDPHPTEENLH
jgi:hypothetical protein